MDFERFTNKAKEAVSASKQLLQRYHHNQLDVEHLLLALLEQEDGVTPRVLQALGVDVAELKTGLERELGKRPEVQVGGGEGQQIFVTPHTQRVFDKAWDVCQRMGDQFVASEHILLAIIEDGHVQPNHLLTRKSPQCGPDRWERSN